MTNLMHSMALEGDRDELRKADGFDLRAGILLALTAVLVTINGALLADAHLSKRLQVSQLIALALAALAALFACVVIAYRLYERAATPETMEAWLAKLEALGSTEVVTATAAKETKEALARIQVNHRVNAVRYGWLILAFASAVTSLAVDVVCIAIHAYTRLYYS